MEFVCPLQTFLRTAGKTAILLNKKLKGPCRRIKRDKLSGTDTKIKRLLKDEKKLEKTEKDPTENKSTKGKSTKEKSSEKYVSADSPLEMIEGPAMLTQFSSLPIPKPHYLHLSVTQIKDQESDVEEEQTGRNEPAGQSSQSESDTGESDNVDTEEENDEDKATKEELYLLLISFFALLGLTHCAMA